jgi:ribose transport system ATP-binding protein
VEPAALNARNVSKSFGGRRALGPLDLSVAPGEIHFLLGHNGSGKSTLIKILSGNHMPDPGAEVRIGGEPMLLGSPTHSRLIGCRFVHQDLGLIESSSVLDNLSFGIGFPTFMGSIRRASAVRQARATLAMAGLDIDPLQPVGRLSKAQQTGVAIARAIHGLPTSDSASARKEGARNDGASGGVRLLVLDEPTAALPADEVSRLLAIVRVCAANGVAVLYVTHRLDEAFEIADRISVLRGGSLVASAPTDQIDREGLIRLLVGSDLARVDRLPEEHRTGEGAPALRVEGLTTNQVSELSFVARPGEIVGFYGLVGSGSESVLRGIFGGTVRISGAVKIGDRAVAANRPDSAVAAGVGYLPPDRKVSGGLMAMSASENLTLADLEPFWRRLRLRKSDERREVGQWFLSLDIRPLDALAAKLWTFSGGNQQKILLAKWLRLKPQVLLLDDPTQGVDIGAKSEIHRQILSAAAAGASVVISSSDDKELVALCSRVLVMRNGSVAQEIRGSQLTLEMLNRAAYNPRGVNGNDS